VKLSTAVVTSFALLLLGCADKGLQSQEAVRQAVIDHLAKRSDLNLTSMQVDVTSVSFRENQADATVAIRLKGGTAEQMMRMRYTLNRQGNKWVVKGKSEAGEMPHQGTMGGAQPGESQSALPPGHPPLGDDQAAQPKSK